MARDRNPTIRILLLGAPGVGKNCLESRFTTTTYPPPYDPALTLNSRRFLTLSPCPPTPTGPITRRLETSHGLPPLQVGQDAVRPYTASSVYSNPASQQPAPTEATAAEGGEMVETTTTVTSPCLDTMTAASAVGAGGCLECMREANTYMIEVINYPRLQLPKERQAILSKGEYDAIMLVYDVASRESFEFASGLHAEIRAATGKHYFHKGRKGRGPVVTLVGNKTDFDAEYASVELALNGHLHDKEAEMQAREVEERNMVHPLWREESTRNVYDEMPMSARSLGRYGSMRELGTDGRRSVMSVDRYSRQQGRLTKSKSIQMIRLNGETPTPRQLRRRASKRELVHSWLETGTPTRETHLEADEDGSTQVDTQDSESTAAARRQVSRVEGEAMTQRLGISVPFLETSAKTGENVEEVFQNVVREALKGMGREVTAEQTEPRPCRNRAHMETGRDSKFSSAANSPVEGILDARRREDAWPVSPVSPHDEERPARAAAPSKERRGSVLRRMSSLFLNKKKQPMVVGVSA